MKKRLHVLKGQIGHCRRLMREDCNEIGRLESEVTMLKGQRDRTLDNLASVRNALVIGPNAPSKDDPLGETVMVRMVLRDCSDMADRKALLEHVTEELRRRMKVMI